MRRGGVDRIGSRVEDLIDLIYSAALHPSLWQRVVIDLAHALGGQKALFIVSANPSCEITTPISYEMDLELLRRWVANYLEYDLWSQAMHGYDEGFVLTGASVVDRSVRRKALWYNDLLRLGSIEDCVSTSLAKQGNVHTIISVYTGGCFQRPEISLMHAISPHLRRALRMQSKIGQLKARVDSFESSLDSISIGMLTLDPLGRVDYVNRSAEQMIAANDGLTVRNQRLHALRRDEDAQLNAAIARAGESAVWPGQPVGTTLSITRPSLRRPFGVEVAPAHRRSDESSPLLSYEMRRSAAVIVTLSDPEAVVEPEPERLVRLFRLTPAEARLAAALAARQSLEDYAGRADISISTARWTLKRVLEKTGCKRQSELVHLVATSVAATLRS